MRFQCSIFPVCCFWLRSSADCWLLAVGLWALWPSPSPLPFPSLGPWLALAFSPYLYDNLATQGRFLYVFFYSTLNFVSIQILRRINSTRIGLHLFDQVHTVKSLKTKCQSESPSKCCTKPKDTLSPVKQIPVKFTEANWSKPKIIWTVKWLI